MAINIKNAEAESLARLVAQEAGETVTEAVTQSLRDRLAKLRARRVADHRLDQILELARGCSSLPDLDRRAPDEILGYGENGLP